VGIPSYSATINYGYFHSHLKQQVPLQPLTTATTSHTAGLADLSILFTRARRLTRRAQICQKRIRTPAATSAATIRAPPASRFCSLELVVLHDEHKYAKNGYVPMRPLLQPPFARHLPHDFAHSSSSPYTTSAKLPKMKIYLFSVPPTHLTGGGG
jgi:hypothetical protein